jgi:hypothetical protein
MAASKLGLRAGPFYYLSIFSKLSQLVNRTGPPKFDLAAAEQCPPLPKGQERVGAAGDFLG